MIDYDSASFRLQKLTALLSTVLVENNENITRNYCTN